MYKCHEGNISYIQALRSLAEVAKIHQVLLRKGHRKKAGNDALPRQDLSQCNELVDDCVCENTSILNTIGKRCAHDVLAPCSTPGTDTSAMDGFAVASELTTNASKERPVKFRVAGIIAAGAKFSDIESPGSRCELCEPDESYCVEIMTGACFPEKQYPEMDAVVKVEDVVLVENQNPRDQSKVQHVLVSAPVKPNQHRRPAGSDFRKGDMVVERNTRIEPKHIMALASVGMSTIRISPDRSFRAVLDSTEKQYELSIGVLPTGSELVNPLDCTSEGAEEDAGRQTLPDSNGPYALSVLQSVSTSFQVDYLGPCPDDELSLAEAFRKAIEIQQYDVLMTSGGVSMGRFDLVRKVFESQFHIDIVFHGCLIRPGAPVMFGVVKWQSGDIHREGCGMTALFGAPGNPLAAATTNRFFLRPYLKMLRASQPCSVEAMMQEVLSETWPVQVQTPTMDEARKKPPKAVSFLLAKYSGPHNAESKTVQTVELLRDQASYKVKPFLYADCWVAVPDGLDQVCSGDQLQSWSLY